MSNFVGGGRWGFGGEFQTGEWIPAEKLTIVQMEQQMLLFKNTLAGFATKSRAKAEEVVMSLSDRLEEQFILQLIDALPER